MVGCCLGAVALAANRSNTASGVRVPARAPLRPHLTGYPDPVTRSVNARFDSAQPGRPAARARSGNPPSLECRLDAGDWDLCRLPMTLTDLDVGPHRFEVRAVNAAGRSGPADAFTWRIQSRSTEPEDAPTEEATPEPAPSVPPAETPTMPTEAPTPPPLPPPLPDHGEPFTIEQTAGLEDLFPGEPAQSLSLRLTNPNRVPIDVTSLTFSFAIEPPGCPSAENFVIVPSDASVEAPLRIAPETSIELPAQGISPPAIAMRELPVDQNACQGAPLELKLEGEAHG